MTHPVRFVHAADIHLDAPFKGVDATDPRVREALIESTYAALDALVDTCIGRELDFLVIAGDVYNASEPSLRAEFAFRDACARLETAGIPVYVARGNHDPANSRSAGLAMPDNVHFFSDSEVERVVFERDGEDACAIYGRSFRTAAEMSDLATGFARRAEDRLAVGVLHTNVGGRPEHEPYSPSSLDDLRAAHMDYWALGHIHKPEVVLAEPLSIYSGCTQGLSPNEPGLRGCRLVTLGPDGASAEEIPTCSVVWDRAEVDASALEALDDALAAIDGAVEAASRAAAGRPVIMRLTLTGRSAVHAVLQEPGRLADLLSQARAGALDRDRWVWIDRIVANTRPTLDINAVRSGQDFAADLVRMSDLLTADPGELAAFVKEAVQPVLSAVDSRDMPALDEAAILERARDLALDRMLAGEER